MTKIVWMLGLTGTFIVLGCASTCPTTQQGQTPIAKATNLELFCEMQTLEGETSPKKVCWEPKENEPLKEGQERLALRCEDRKLEGNPKAQKVCYRTQEITCEERIVTGSRLPQKVCETAADKKMRELYDQLALEQIQRSTPQ